MINLKQKKSLKIKRPNWLNNRVPINKGNIVDLYVSLTHNRVKVSGRATVALCPFHEDTKPSFALYEDNATYYCFSCGKHGDSINLVKELQGVDFAEALAIIKGS